MLHSIYDLCYNPDGKQIILAAGQNVMVYDNNNGALIQILRGSQQIILFWLFFCSINLLICDRPQRYGILRVLCKRRQKICLG